MYFQKNKYLVWIFFSFHFCNSAFIILFSSSTQLNEDPQIVLVSNFLSLQLENSSTSTYNVKYNIGRLGGATANYLQPICYHVTGNLYDTYLFSDEKDSRFRIGINLRKVNRLLPIGAFCEIVCQHSFA